jgi:hypothetical protein
MEGTLKIGSGFFANEIGKIKIGRRMCASTGLEARDLKGL